ncbi:unnamed protein product [Didymodactylos carnosus]|uniref:Adenosine kinase n=1 Tax=Didymodactylos carnosus TaxID=1234261 RepID=A0A815Q1X9_9BILA|nr:unnamed protein product [Didymodactylos carnosus]CAF1457098.1 unnamed protein product [Didymodactylos carnosus]CAF4104894.1 unnamed protein product [Didymodactylos carnosus]CAF4328624.1 unnamed protein product [Didymodactylos carnosus]
MASTDVRKHGSAFSKSVLRDGCFFGIGNPLLDISAQVDPEIMRNYNLRPAAENDGLTTAYQVNPNLSTGKCAMLLTPNSRAMVTSLGASEEFSVKQLVNSDWAYIEKAQIICSEDYFIGSSPEAFLKVAQYAHSEQKTFCMTLSAKFIAGKRLGGWLLCALQYADFVFGYEEATKVFGRTHLDVEV